MLKKKVSRVFAALLGAVMLLTAAGTGTAFADGGTTGGETADGKWITYSFSASSGKTDWFEKTDNVNLRGDEGYDIDSWYGLDNGESEIVFCFDGSKSITENGTVYDMNGTPKQIKFKRCHWGSGTSVSYSYYISNDKNVWTAFPAGNVQDNGAAAGSPGWATFGTVSLTIPAEYTEEDVTKTVKYVKVAATTVLGSGPAAAIYQPEITYEAFRRGFDVAHSTMVFPSANDLKLNFDMALSESAADPANYSVKDSAGNEAVIESVVIAEDNTAAFTFANALKPYTDYTVTVSDAVKTARNSELTVKSAGFSTTAKDFSQNDEIYFKDSLCNQDWLDGVSKDAEYDTRALKLYALNGGSFSFVFDGSKAVALDDGTSCSVSGIPSKVKFALNWWGNDLPGIEQNISVTFCDTDGNVIQQAPLISYNVDNKGYTGSEIWDGIDGNWNQSGAWNGCGGRIYDINKNEIPRNTAKITFSGVGQCFISNVQAKWLPVSISGDIAAINGEIPAADTLSVRYDAKINESSFKTQDIGILMFDGSSTSYLTVTKAEVSGSTVILTLDKKLKTGAQCQLKMPALKTAEGWSVSEINKDFIPGSEYKTVTFTDTNPGDSWLIADNGGSGWEEGAFSKWYSGKADGSGAEITIALDGEHFKKQDGKRYKLNGRMDEISFLGMHFGGKNKENIRLYISENGTDWTSIGTAEDYAVPNNWDRPSVYPIADGWVGSERVTVGRAALGESTKYVKLLLEPCTGIGEPRITYTVPVENYEINDVSYTSSEDGASVTAAGKVYFNCDGEKASATFTVITAAYNGGVLTDVKSDILTAEKGGAADFSQTVKADENTEVRTYLFDSSANLRPLADMYK